MRFLPGPQGPCVRKICFWCGPASAPEFAEPTLPVRILAGGPRASPTQIRECSSYFVGEGLKVNRPKAERSHPGVCPSRRSPEWSVARRRGGPIWPPADRSGISCGGNRTALYPRRGEAEGESTEGRERPPWGVPFPAPL